MQLGKLGVKLNNLACLIKKISVFTKALFIYSCLLKKLEEFLASLSRKKFQEDPFFCQIFNHHFEKKVKNYAIVGGCVDGVVVRAPASHSKGPGFKPWCFQS